MQQSQGADIFVFYGHAISGEKQWREKIGDFDTAEDNIELTGTQDTAFGELEIFYNSGSDATILNYGEGPIVPAAALRQAA
ncbi:hypothetical protein [Cribrihabitans pelagius]|uniref:hypothetical protein n=1 Tax=Cribrihabitans pelagius TaxID=1765746 RepID=UPI003B5A7ED8